MKAIGVLLLLFVASCSSVPSKPGVSQPYSGRFYKVTDARLFSVEILLKDVDLSVGMNSFDMIVRDDNGKGLDEADVEIVPWMPTMGHGVQSEPRITSKGRGLYRVENLEANMPGYWQFKVVIKAGGIEDSVVFDFPSVRPDAESM